MLENCDVIANFQVTTCLEQYRSQIQDAQYVNFFVNANLTKNENRTKKFAIQLSHYLFD